MDAERASGTKRECLCCGREISGPFRGRVPNYCSADCREFVKFLAAAEIRLQRLYPDAAHRRELRSQLFTMANQINSL